MREFKVGDLVKVDRRDGKVFYTVITRIDENGIIKGFWKANLTYFQWTETHADINITNVENLTFISDDKELSEFAIKVLSGVDLEAKNYVEELIKQQDKSIVYE